MTLCVAWVQRGQIALISDSFLTTVTKAGTKSEDVGLKIFEVQSEIRNARTDTVSSASFGLAFAGDTLHAMLVKDKLIGLLRSITINPLRANEYSMDDIADLARELLISVARRFDNIGISVSTVIFLAGYCPTEGRLRLFEIDFENGAATMIERQGFDCFAIGSGSGAFLKEWKSGKYLTPYLAVRAVIDGNLDPNVGGAIQVGAFEKNNFRLYGIAMGPGFNNRFIAGENVDRMPSAAFVPTGQYMAPFEPPPNAAQ